ncbi:hypothetical protein QEN19_001742 [Hanseniaspora menglaensis]
MSESSRIINCVTRLPYSITKVTTHPADNSTETVEYKIDSVTGNTSLYTSLLNDAVTESRLFKDTNVSSEIIVGWTGDIQHFDKFELKTETISNNNSDSAHFNHDSITDDINITNTNMARNNSSISTGTTSQKKVLLNEDDNVKLRGVHTYYTLNDPSSGNKNSDTMDFENKLDTEEGAFDHFAVSQKEQKYLTKRLNEEIITNNSNRQTTMEPIFLPATTSKKNQWLKYADKILYPDFHYILSPFLQDLKFDTTDTKKEKWFEFVKFNEEYAEKVAQIYQPGDIIIVHDYHLMLLPQMIRMKLNSKSASQKLHLTIGYFHHVTFPSFEYFRSLTYRKELVDGMLGSNVIFFQSPSFSRHFVSCCKRLLDCTWSFSSPNSDQDSNSEDPDGQYHVSAYGNDVLIKCSPQGINKPMLIENSFSESVDTKVQALLQAYEGKKIIFGRDRMDGCKGILQKLQGFDTLLDMFPYWKDKIVYIQVSTPRIKTAKRQVQGVSNNEVEEDVDEDESEDFELERQIMEMINEINTKHGSFNYQPVQHYHMKIPKDVYLALLRVADVFFVGSIRDAINLSGLEYVTVQTHAKIKELDSSAITEKEIKINPLILSEFSGTPLSHQDCYIINPWDSVAVAKTLDMALTEQYTLTSEKDVRDEVKRIYDKIPSLKDWSSDIITTLSSLLTVNTKITPLLNLSLLKQLYKSSKKRLFCFDYDGTLTPIVQDPAAAIPTAKLYNILTKLLKDPKNEVWIISGRDQVFLNKWFGDDRFTGTENKMGLSAEHGCFLKSPDSAEGWVNLTEKYNLKIWQDKCFAVMDAFTHKTPGAFIELKKVALTWHYRRAVPELGAFHAEAMKDELEAAFASDKYKEFDLEVMEGKMNIEVRPKFINKGEIVRNLYNHSNPEFVLCLGDDKTDEDMFNVLNSYENGEGIYPVSVGSASKKTVAKAHLSDPARVLNTLSALCE